jgi:predicted TIM-barrel fold metal-dependent hydrolase
MLIDEPEPRTRGQPHEEDAFESLSTTRASSPRLSPFLSRDLRWLLKAAVEKSGRWKRTRKWRTDQPRFARKLPASRRSRLWYHIHEAVAGAS